jgi:hypothetical protein
MSFAALVDRVRDDFMEMPGLELTMAQAVRLWSLGLDDCRTVVDALVDAGFLMWTARRTIMRSGGELRMLDSRLDPAHITVRAVGKRNNSVGRD